MVAEMLVQRQMKCEEEDWAVDSGQKVGHYSGQNCTSRVVGERNLGGASEWLTSVFEMALHSIQVPVRSEARNALRAGLRQPLQHSVDQVVMLRLFG